MSLSKPWETGKDRTAWYVAVLGVTKLNTTELLNNDKPYEQVTICQWRESKVSGGGDDALVSAEQPGAGDGILQGWCSHLRL